jgi:PAS domain S-box-containing protein
MENTDSRSQDKKSINNELMRLLIESAKDYAIFTCDTERNVNSWNKGAEAMMGYSEQEIIGQSADIIFTPEDRAKNAPAMEAAKARDEGVAANERFHLRKNESRFYGSGTVRPLLDDNGDFIGFVKIMRDLTDSKMLEQHKDEFIGIASHELKTPVTSIRTYTELLLEVFNAEADPKSAAIIEKLNKQVNRLSNLVNDLLDVTRITAGEIELQWAKFNIDELIAEVVEDMRPLAPQHTFRTDLNTLTEINADAGRLSQVLINLISNAVKYSEENSEVVIRSNDVGGSVMISIRDDGSGIGAEFHERIFQRFYKTSKIDISATSGLGLGLYISKDIVERHGGKIWLESEEGKGATFYVTLPF